jgi:cysteine sulfinate desulfinase/cysteine desulfurase-like protein
MRRLSAGRCSIWKDDAATDRPRQVTHRFPRPTLAKERYGRPRSLHSLGQRSRSGVKATRYFKEQVLRKRPYIDPAWCTQIVSEPIH